VDGTWSFKSVEDYYISMDINYSYLRLKTEIGITERFYFERKGDNLYLMSAYSDQHYWINNMGIARFTKNGGTRLKA
jgi:hypothetical protein